jgi:hypothetical protein
MTLREKRYADGLAVLLDYARAQKANGQDCDPTFIERCAYTWLQEPAQVIVDGEGCSNERSVSAQHARAGGCCGLPQARS